MPISNSTDRFNGVLASLAIKVPCVVASDVDLVLSGEQTVNGIAVTTNDRVLVMSQTDATENGIYDVTSTAWNRSADFDGNRDDLSNGCRFRDLHVRDHGESLGKYVLVTDRNEVQAPGLDFWTGIQFGGNCDKLTRCDKQFHELNRIDDDGLGGAVENPAVPGFKKLSNR